MKQRKTSYTMKWMVACSVVAVMITAITPWQQVANACSRILWNDNKLAVLVGRTMDRPESTQPILTVFPRGMERDGGVREPKLLSRRTQPSGCPSMAA